VPTYRGAHSLDTWTTGGWTSTATTWALSGTPTYASNATLIYAWESITPTVVYQDGTEPVATERADEPARWMGAADPPTTADARARAAELLRLVLSREQWASWEADERFELTGSAGGCYRVRRGVQGNVHLMRNGHAVETLCAHPPLIDDGHNLPTEDVIVAQVLALRHDEPGFRATANIGRLEVA
jgi:hypothetical protein